MDCVDYAQYRFDPLAHEELREATRRAFVDIFDVNNEKAVLVMNYLIGVTQWSQTVQCSDPIFNSQAVALKGVMAGIKQQLNMKPIQEIDANE